MNSLARFKYRKNGHEIWNADGWETDSLKMVARE
jgi:hypothetical protein